MTAKIFSNDFNRIIAATKGFVCAGPIPVPKPHKFIRLEFCTEDSSVAASAVDGYRISIEHAKCECDVDFTAYINAKTKLPRGMDATIEIVGEDAIIRCGDFIYGCPQPDGEFLDVEKALPKGEITFQYGVNGNYLLSALQAAKVSCGGSFQKPVVLEFRGELEPVLLRTNENDIKMVPPVKINRD